MQKRFAGFHIGRQIGCVMLGAWGGAAIALETSLSPNPTFPIQQMVLGEEQNTKVSSSPLGKTHSHRSVEEEDKRLMDTGLGTSFSEKEAFEKENGRKSSGLASEASLPPQANALERSSVAASSVSSKDMREGHAAAFSVGQMANQAQTLVAASFTFSATHLQRDLHHLSAHFSPEAWQMLQDQLFSWQHGHLKSVVLDQRVDTLGLCVDAPETKGYEVGPNQSYLMQFEFTVMVVAHHAKPQKRLFKVLSTMRFFSSSDRQGPGALIESMQITPMTQWGQSFSI